jgi:hypothetical protein
MVSNNHLKKTEDRAGELSEDMEWLEMVAVGNVVVVAVVVAAGDN